MNNIYSIIRSMAHPSPAAHDFDRRRFPIGLVPQSPGFRFLDLPSEIRNIVYEMLVADGINVAAGMISRRYPILQSSRQLRNECFAILCSTSVFYIDLTVPGHYAKFLEWVYGLDNDSVSRIRYVRFQSTLKGPQVLRCCNPRKVFFTFRGEFGASSYILDFGFSETCCRDWLCPCLDFAGNNVWSLSLDMLGPLIPPTRPGSLTASQLVTWARVILGWAAIQL